MNAPAGFWRRYAAYSLDLAILGLLVSPLVWLRVSWAWPRLTGTFSAVQMRMLELLDASLANGGDPLSTAMGAMSDAALRDNMTTLSDLVTKLTVFVTVLVFVVAAAWFIPTESSRWQASPGKRAAGLRVTDMAGARCQPGRIALRFVAGIPSWLLFNLGHALAAWTPGKRALHDYLAGTRVELAPGAPATMPGWVRSWLLLQAVLFCGFNGFVLLRYAQLMSEVMNTGLP